MALFRARRSEIRVVLTDLVMPGTQGEELIRALRKLDPLVKIIAITGISDRRKLAETEALGVAKVILKPYSGDELLRALREVLSSPTSSGPEL
jgi:DNA-binding NarL/FixJ family response regulator